MLLLLQPLWVKILSLVQAKGNKGDRSAQAVQDEASLSPVVTRAGFWPVKFKRDEMRAAALLCAGNDNAVLTGLTVQRH